MRLSDNGAAISASAQGRRYDIVVGYNLSQLQLGPVIEPVLVLGATIGGCFVLHEYVIRRIRVLRPLFGLGWGSAVVRGSKSNKAT